MARPAGTHASRIRSANSTNDVHAPCQAGSNSSGDPDRCCLPPLELLHLEADLWPLWAGCTHLTCRASACYPLSPKAMERSLVLEGDARFRRFIQRVAAYQNVSIVTIGGSVALGHGTGGTRHDPKREDGNGNAHDRFVRWLRWRYPPGKHITYRKRAVAASSSFFALVSLPVLIKSPYPDLVLWDYSTNDNMDMPASLPAVLESYRSALRATVERLARALLLLPSRPAVLFLSLPRGCGADNDDINSRDMQSLVYEPVSRLYGLVLVSYLDAMAASDTKGHLYDTFYKCHPIWYSSQLIADCMSYAWARVELSHGTATRQDGPDSNALMPSLPNIRYADTAADSLQPCKGGWIASMGAGLENGLLPWGTPSLAWQYVAGAKPGWLFNASLSKQPADALLLEPITFAVRFGSSPKLVLAYLRSHANVGNALFWIHNRSSDESSRAAALQAYEQQQRFRRACDELAASRQCLRHPTRCDALSMPLECNMHRSGTLPDPWVLDGRWADESSQTVAKGFTSGVGSKVSSTWNKMVLCELLLPDANVSLSEPDSSQLISIAMLGAAPRPPGFGRALRAVRHTASAARAGIFKLVSLHSC